MSTPLPWVRIEQLCQRHLNLNWTSSNSRDIILIIGFHFPWNFLDFPHAQLFRVWFEICFKFMKKSSRWKLDFSYISLLDWLTTRMKSENGGKMSKESEKICQTSFCVIVYVKSIDDTRANDRKIHKLQHQLSSEKTSNFEIWIILNGDHQASNIVKLSYDTCVLIKMKSEPTLPITCWILSESKSYIVSITTIIRGKMWKSHHLITHI